MAFKMKGFNPGKGTGMGNGFSRVTLNPATRDDPEGITIGNPEGMGGATVDGETREDLKNKEKASETDRMMFEDLNNRLEEYKNDPYKVDILSQGEKLTQGDYKDWLKKNAKQLKKDGLLDINWKPGQKPKRFDAQRLFRDKINEARNIDNDLKLSAEQGYGFNESELADFGIYGKENEYTPNPRMAGNIERNTENLRIEDLKNIGNKRMDRIKKAIKEGKDIPTSDLSWLASRGPKNDIPEFNKFIYDYVMPYQRHTRGGSEESNDKNADKLQGLLDSGMSIDQAYANLNITSPSTEGKIINFSDDTRASKMGGRLLDKFENNRFVKPDDFLIERDNLLDLSADNNVEYEDDITRDMDKMIADKEKPPVEEEVAIGGDGNEVEETETKKEEETFDPKDYNKDGVVDYLDKRMGPPKTNSAYAKWNNKNLENMAKQTLMNADANPFKFGSKEHEQYTNNKSRARGLAMKQKYNKFL